MVALAGADKDDEATLFVEIGSDLILSEIRSYIDMGPF
jgi:hypothetical protein